MWLFETIVQKKKQVAIGPLEYSASATQAKTTHGVKVCVLIPLSLALHLTLSARGHPLSNVTWADAMAYHHASEAAAQADISERDEDSDESASDPSPSPDPTRASTYDSHTDYSNSGTDYTDYATTSAYSSDGEDEDRPPAADDSLLPLAATSSFPSRLRMSFPSDDEEDDHVPASPPRKRRKGKRKAESESKPRRKYTKTNEAMLLEAKRYQVSGEEDDSALQGPSSTAPALKRKRSSRNTGAHYCFSARGNAMDPSR